jgi:hypothetical protein
VREKLYRKLRESCKQLLVCTLSACNSWELSTIAYSSAWLLYATSWRAIPRSTASDNFSLR